MTKTETVDLILTLAKYGTKAHKALTRNALLKRHTSEQVEALAADLVERAKRGRVVHLSAMGEAVCGRVRDGVDSLTASLSVDSADVTCRYCREAVGLDTQNDTTPEEEAEVAEFLAEVERKAARSSARPTRREPREPAQVRTETIPEEGVQIYFPRRGAEPVRALLLPGGKVAMGDVLYPSPSAAGRVASGCEVSGWKRWKVDLDGRPYRIEVYRDGDSARRVSPATRTA